MRVAAASFSVLWVALLGIAAGQSAEWRRAGADNHDALGTDVTWLDDLDGDGVRDFACTAHSGYFPLAVEGSVQLRSGCDGALLREITAGVVGDGFGWFLAALDDVDGDGTGDLAVAAPYEAGTGTYGGALVVCSVATGAVIRRHDHDASAPYFGGRVAGVDDLDGDGVDDYLTSHATVSGQVALVSGATGALLRLHVAPNQGAFGSELARVGDLDRDGSDDYAVTAPTEVGPAGSGRIYVYSGATGALVLSSDAFARAGLFGPDDVVGVGDLDGDLVDDLVIGGVYSAMALSGSNGATLWVQTSVSGTAHEQVGRFVLGGDLDGDRDLDLAVGGQDTSSIWIVDLATGAPSGSIALAAPCGHALQGGIDSDGDGLGDLLVGMSSADAPQQDAGAGRLEVIDGATRSPRFAVRGTAYSAALGRASVLLDDRDGDGWREIAVGLPGGEGDNRGAVAVLSGRDGRELQRFTSAVASDEFGFALAAVGDQDGDGVEELLVGAPGDGGGRVELLSGANGALLRTWSPGAKNGRLGHAVASASDAAGNWQVALGDPEFDVGGAAVGRIELHDLATATRIAAVNGRSSDGGYAHALAAVGDTDGDGQSDWAVGVLLHQRWGVGALELLSGADGSRLWRLNGKLGGDYVGASVSACGDLDVDGWPDLLTGHPNHLGLVLGLSGRDGRRLLRLQGTLSSSGASQEYGAAVRGVGDIDGDAVGDLAIGIPRYSEVAILRGAVELRSGSNGSLLKRIDGALEDGLLFGASLATAHRDGSCDLDGDGTADLVAAAELQQGGVLSATRLAPTLLAIEPSAAAAGETAVATLRGGPAGAAAGLYWVDFAGAAVDRFVLIGMLDAQSRFAFSETIPPGLAGLTATFRGYSIGFAGRVVASFDETLLFE